MRFCFCQISNNLINPSSDSTAEKFYDTFWQEKRKDGYYKPEHFWELPLWIAEICYTLPDDVERELHIVTDADAELPEADLYLFSVLDISVKIIQHIVYNNPKRRFDLGGYTAFADDLYSNVMWFDSVKRFCDFYHFDYKYGTDYSLFAGTKCIPRLTLSTGCRHHCKFCTVPNEVTEKCQHEIMKQVESFRPLRFKLVYINDKTFGQAKNHWYLKAVYHRIKKYNPKFKGFIVQTTALMIEAKDIKFWEEHHIEVVEFGLETFNDSLLKRYRKPVTEDRVRRAFDRLFVAGVKIIPNIILGLPGETIKTYRSTHDWLWIWRRDFYSLNIYTLTVYDNTGLANELESGDGDKNETGSDRTFWTPEERVAFGHWSESFYKLGIDIVKG